MQRSHFDILANQPLHDVEVVNHQVEHHVDVQRAGRELAYAMNLEIDRITHMWPEREQRWTETFGMAHLQNGAALLGGSNHQVGFIQGARDWFFDQDVNAVLKQGASNRAVRFSGYSETHSVDLTDQIAPVGS